MQQGRGGAGRGGAGRGGAVGNAARAGAPSTAARKPVSKPPWKGPLDVPGSGGGGIAQQENKPPSYVQESLATTLPNFSRPVHVGDRVIDKHSKREGICLYIGPADFAKGKSVCGLRLDRKRTTTDCDGKYRGERYFRCTPGHGLYIPVEDAEFAGVAGDDDMSHLRDAGPGRGSAAGPPQGRQLARGPSGSAEEAAAGPSEDFDLEKELEPIVGLTEVKEMLRQELARVEVRKKRAGMGVNDDRTMHMLFLGNPGTGKTTIARLVARMFYSIGMLKKGQLIEVSRKVRGSDRAARAHPPGLASARSPLACTPRAAFFPRTQHVVAMRRALWTTQTPDQNAFTHDGAMNI
jgi:hypothetical protein